MKIKITDGTKITAALQSAQGQAQARLLTAENLLASAKCAEEKLGFLPQVLRVGARVEVDPHRVPHTYKYRADGTVANLHRSPSPGI